MRALLGLAFLVLLGFGASSVGLDQPPGAVVPAVAAQVVRGVDGDTIRANVTLDGATKEEPVRLIGVDTPETKHPTKGVECYGPEASKFTTGSLMGRTVWLEWDVERRDRYGRLLAYVWTEAPDDTPESGMFNARLLAEGYGRTLVVRPNDAHAPLFGALQQQAQRAGHGLWGACPLGGTR